MPSPAGQVSRCAIAAVLGGWVVFRTLALTLAVDEVVVEPQRPNLSTAPVSEDVELNESNSSDGNNRAEIPIAHGSSRAPSTWPAELVQRSAFVIFGPPPPAATAPSVSPNGIAAGRNAVLAAATRPFEQPQVPGIPAPYSTRKSGLSGSAWVLARTGGGAPALGAGGQLGGSQAGARLFWEPGPRGFALTGRISAPLGQRLGREASAGVGYRMRHGGLLLERRIGIDRGGRDAMSLTAYAGVSEVALPARFRLDAYAQAGFVGLKARDGFIDGALRAERSLFESGRAPLSFGAGIWGGAQPGVSRIDAGPQIVARLPIGKTSFRASAEWRQRVAGNASPDSGPSATIGFDF